MDAKIKAWIIGIFSSLGLILVFGVPTALIPNPWFFRMIESNFLDYLFLIVSSMLLGAYFGVHFYKRSIKKICGSSVVSGGVGSFLAFSCPICNKILVLLFGATALMNYLDPYRPLIGVSSLGLLGGSLYWKIKK